MSMVARHSITAIWLLLLAATGLSWLLGHGIGSGRPGNVAIILIGAVKIRFVLLWFMELRTAPLPWRLAFEFWLAALTIALVGLYLFGASAI